MPKLWTISSIAACVAGLALIVPGPALAAAGPRSGAPAARVDRVPLRSQAGVATVALKLVGAVFVKLRDTTINRGANTVVGGGLGALLQLAGALGLPLAKSDLDPAKEQLEALQSQLVQLQDQVGRIEGRLERTHASQLLHQSASTTSLIDSAMKRLRFIAGHPDDRSPGVAAELTDQIRQLSNAPEYFQHILNSKLADNPIKATSRALAVTSRFFSRRQSEQVQAVVDYYAIHEADLAILLTNYWNANPADYSVTYRKQRIAEIEASITETERDSLPAPMPAHMFIDTRTPTVMWGTDNREVDGVAVVEQNLETRRDLPMLGFHNWQMPSVPDYHNLIRGAPENPRAWLQTETGVSLEHPLVWSYNSFTIFPSVNGKHYGHVIYANAFDLRSAKNEPYKRGAGYLNSYLPTPCRHIKPCLAGQSRAAGHELKKFLEVKRAGLLLLRYLRPGERYWFGAL